METLEIKNIRASYEKKEALKDINLTIKSGSFNALIGRNGAGKSTLLKVISSVLKPNLGEILIDEKNIKDFSKKDLAKILSFMPQNINTDFPFCVEDFIMFGRYPYMNILKIPSQADFDAVWRVIDFMQIGDFCKRNINELSGGEKQKVLIAQTIVQGADILIFDEPTAHLDIGAQYSILEFLKELNEKSHKTIIAALHDLNAAGEFCENIILMDEGKIKASGAPNEVLDYKNIEDAYKTLVCTKENPISGKPYIIPVRKQQR